MITDGYLCFDTLGVLKEMDSSLSRAIIWNSGGAASLIVFLKCLGFTWEQMESKLNDLKCLPNIIYGGSLEPGSNQETKREIVSWMVDIINGKKVFSQDTTMKEIYKLTKIFPNMITSNGYINPKTHPDVALLDAILASMCNFGVYDNHKIEDEEFSSFIVHNPYPLELEVKLENVSSKTLYISNYSKLYNIEVFSLFDRVENMLIQQYFDRVYKIINDIRSETHIMVNGIFDRTELTSYEIKQRIDNGKSHALLFKNGESTLKYMDTIIQKIKNQS